VIARRGVFLSLSNLPFWYVAVIEGRAVDRWGVTGLLPADGLPAFAGLAAILWLARRVRLTLWENAVAVTAPSPTL